MPQQAVVSLAVLAVGFVMWAPVKHALVALLAVTVLIPDLLVIPNGFTSYLQIYRVVTVAFGLSLVFRQRRGELPAGVFRVTPIHIAFGCYAAVAFVNGVALAPPATGAAAAVTGWVGILDQLVFFVVVLAALRAIGDVWWTCRVIAVVLVASTGIAIVEHYTGRSWSRFFFEDMPSLLRRIDPARNLQGRGGQVRVRGAAQFALAFAWASAILLPVLIAVTARARRWVIPGLVGIGVAVTAIYWTYSRSAVVGATASLAIVWLASRGNRGVGLLVAGAAVIAAIVFLSSPDLLSPFTAKEARGSADVRAQRIPVVLGVAAERPLTGQGLSGLDVLDIPTTDSTFLLVYAELGVVGLAAFMALLVTTIAVALPTLRGPPQQRLLGAAVLTGMIMTMAGAASYDLFSITGSALMFWLLAGLAVAASERDEAVATERRSRRRFPRRFALVPGALALGVLILAATPTRAAAGYRFEPFSSALEARARGPLDRRSRAFIATACGIARAVVATESGAKVFCRDTSEGLGDLRIEAGNAEQLNELARRVETTAVRFLPGIRLAATQEEMTARSTWTETAPVWAGASSLILAIAASPIGRRRRARIVSS